MRVLNLNKLLSGALSFSSQLEKYKFADAFADTDLCRWAKFSANSDQYLQATYSVATTIYYAYLLNTNLSATASVVLQCSDDGFSSIAESHALTGYGTDWLYRNDAGLNYKAYRIAITDTTVTYPRLSKLYLGGYTQLPGATSIEESPKSKSKSNKTDSGQIKGYATVILRSLTVAFEEVGKEERDAMDAWFAAFDKFTPFIFILYEDSLDVNAPLYCNLTDDIDWKKNMTQGISYQGTIKLEECK